MQNAITMIMGFGQSAIEYFQGYYSYLIGRQTDSTQSI